MDMGLLVYTDNSGFVEETQLEEFLCLVGHGPAVLLPARLRLEHQQFYTFQALSSHMRVFVEKTVWLQQSRIL